MAIRVVVAGDRDWNHLPSVRACLQALHDLHRIELVVEGGQRGADFCAHVAATSLGFPVKTESNRSASPSG
jgi:YspA, cpYpsA-related SLOG family